MNDLCPHCREVRALDVRTKTMHKKSPRGKLTKTVVISYFCATLGFFVRSEEADVKVKAKT